MIIKKTEFFAINQDGTPHDGYSGILIPKKVQDFLKQIDFKVPDGGLLESSRHYCAYQFNFPVQNQGMLLS